VTYLHDLWTWFRSLQTEVSLVNADCDEPVHWATHVISWIHRIKTQCSDRYSLRKKNVNQSCQEKRVLSVS